MSRAIRSLKPLPGAALGVTASNVAAQPAASVASAAAPASSSPSDASSSASSATSSAAATAAIAAHSAADVTVLKSASRVLLDMFDNPAYTLPAQLRMLEIQLNNPTVQLDLNMRGRRGQDLLMRIIQLHCWAELRCTVEGRQVFSNRAHVHRLMEWLDAPAGYDTHAVDDEGNNALHVLSSFSVPALNDPHSFAVQLIAKLVARGLDVNRPGELGRTAVNHVGSACSHSWSCVVNSSITPLLLSQYAADPNVADRDGNVAAYNLVRQQQWRLLEQITTPAADGGDRAAAASRRSAMTRTKSNAGVGAGAGVSVDSSDSASSSLGSMWHTQPVLRFQLFQRNHAGEHAIDCAARLYRTNPGSRDARATHELMQRLSRSWHKGVRSQLQSQIQAHIPVTVLADLCVQYCDGSGRVFLSS